MASNGSLESYIADANECVKFKLVTCAEDLEEDFAENKAPKGKAAVNVDKEARPPRIESFIPDMTYQFFGENENIFGYKNLTIKVYYSCAKLNIYLGMNYSSIVNKDKTGVAPDNVIKTIADDFQTKVTNNLTEFSASLANEKTFVPYGELVQEFTIDYQPEGGQSRKRFFQVFKGHNSVAGFPAYHERMQTLLKFYIEAASYISIDDERWDFYIMYEKLSLEESCNGERMPLDFQYCFVGFSTVYRFYAYPNKVRPRISQFLILPPFQRMGLGTELLKLMYSVYNSTDNFAIDIQVEDPSETFKLLRDIVDCQLCKSLPSFAVGELKGRFTKRMHTEAREKYKITKQQARRVYEILRLKSIDRKNEEEYREYRVSIKQRFNAPYQKQLKDLERAKPKISDTEYASIMKSTQMPREVRVAMLGKQFDELEKEYLAVIEKLA